MEWAKPLCQSCFSRNQNAAVPLQGIVCVCLCVCVLLWKEPRLVSPPHLHWLARFSLVVRACVCVCACLLVVEARRYLKNVLAQRLQLISRMYAPTRPCEIYFVL